MSIENYRVLTLNKQWVACNAISLKKAIILLFSCYDDGEPKAKIIDPYDDFRLFTWNDWSRLKLGDNDQCIKTSSSTFKVPEIILLTRYEKFPPQPIKFSRSALFQRDSFKCQYCGKKPGTSNLTLDHILPKSKGGKTTWENIVISCIPCNTKKADKFLYETDMKLLSKPKKPTLLLFKNIKNYPKSWENFISNVYWNIELENDN